MKELDSHREQLKDGKLTSQRTILSVRSQKAIYTGKKKGRTFQQGLLQSLSARKINKFPCALMVKGMSLAYTLSSLQRLLREGPDKGTFFFFLKNIFIYLFLIYLFLLSHKLPYDSAVILLGIYPGHKNTQQKYHLNFYVHCSTIRSTTWK